MLDNVPYCVIDAMAQGLAANYELFGIFLYLQIMMVFFGKKVILS